jgi:hypothetical protein
MKPLREELEQAVRDSITDEMMKHFKKKVLDVLCDIESQMEDNIQNDISYNIAYICERMADDAIESMLRGDEDQMRRYLGCKPGGYTGRERCGEVIHGKLFETGVIETRRKLVDTFPGLLKDERVLDLESQVSSLVSQVNKLNLQLEECRMARSD